MAATEGQPSTQYKLDGRKDEILFLGARSKISVEFNVWTRPRDPRTPLELLRTLGWFNRLASDSSIVAVSNSGALRGSGNRGKVPLVVRSARSLRPWRSFDGGVDGSFFRGELLVVGAPP